MDNWENFDEPIIFTYCTFKNNKGYNGLEKKMSSIIAW